VKLIEICATIGAPGLAVLHIIATLCNMCEVNIHALCMLSVYLQFLYIISAGSAVAHAVATLGACGQKDRIRRSPQRVQLHRESGYPVGQDAGIVGTVSGIVALRRGPEWVMSSDRGSLHWLEWRYISAAIIHY
jgi:hypothetical protein